MISDSPPKKQDPCIHDLTHYRKQGASMLLTVPKSLRELLDWKDGELLVVSAIDNSLRVLPVRVDIIDQVRPYVKETERIH